MKLSLAMLDSILEFPPQLLLKVFFSLFFIWFTLLIVCWLDSLTSFGRLLMTEDRSVDYSRFWLEVAPNNL